MVGESHEVRSCIVPCKPILEWQREHLKEMKELQACVKGKTSQAQFRWIIGGIVFFMVVVMGGAQWAIVKNMGDISTSIQVVSKSVSNMADKVNYHIYTDDARHIRTEEKIDKIRDEHHTFKYGGE